MFPRSWSSRYAAAATCGLALTSNIAGWGCGPRIRRLQHRQGFPSLWDPQTAHLRLLVHSPENHLEQQVVGSHTCPRPFDDHRNLVLHEEPGYLVGMADSIKVEEFAEVRGAFHCEHKPGNQGSVEKGQAVLCEACSTQFASDAVLVGEGYTLRQTAFGGWVKSKAAAK